MTLTEFLIARIAEDEAWARAATPGPWYWDAPSDRKWPEGDESLRTSGQQSDGRYDDSVLHAWGHDAYGIAGRAEDRAHIARFDPARVLAECAAKRFIVRLLDSVEFTEADALREILVALAMIWEDHPDYAEARRL